MATTVRDVISGSLRLIGAIAAGETASASEASDALSSLNAMLSSWSTNGLMIYKYQREVFLLTAGKAKYTIGPLADFNTIRPITIQTAKFTDPTVVVTELTPFIPGVPMVTPDIPATYLTTITANQELPVQILNIQEWSAIFDKNITSTVPTKMYVEGTYPAETINLWPVPSVGAGIVLYTLKPLNNFLLVTDDFNLPDGYERAIRYNLAQEIAPEYGKEASPTVQQIASDSKADLQRKNTKPVYMKSDVSGIASNKFFNIITGE